MTVYSVWYRDDSQAEIDNIPVSPRYSLRTLDQLLSAAREHNITHMSIKYGVPPLHKIAHHLKQLKLDEQPDSDQSDRLDNLNLPSNTVVVFLWSMVNNNEQYRSPAYCSLCSLL